MPRRLLPFVAAGLALARAVPAAEAAPPKRAIVISADRLHDGLGRCLAPGEMLVEDGVIKSLGTTVKAPEGAERWERMSVITPWLVDPAVRVDLGRGEAGRPEAALLSAADARPVLDPWTPELRGRGLGAIGLVPGGGAGLVGRSSTAGTREGAQSGAPLLREHAALCFVLAEDVPGSASRAAARQSLSLLLEESETARRKEKEAKDESEGADRHARRDRPGGPAARGERDEAEPQPARDVILEVVDKKLPLRVRLSRAADALSVLQLAESRGLQAILDGCRGCAEIAGEIGRSQALVVLDPLHEPGGRSNGIDPDPGLPGELARAGARLAVTGGGTWPAGPACLRSAAAALAGAGAPEEIAVAAMTGRAAEAAGIPGEIVLAPGHPARFLAWSGSPLDPASTLGRALDVRDFEAPAEPAP